MLRKSNETRAGESAYRVYKYTRSIPSPGFYGTGARDDRPTRHNRRRERRIRRAIIYSFLRDADRGETEEKWRWNSFQLEENNASQQRTMYL